MNTMPTMNHYTSRPASEVKQGEFIKFKPTDTAPIWVRDGYDRSLRKYCFHKFDDVNHFTFKKGSTPCFVDFEF